MAVPSLYVRSQGGCVGRARKLMLTLAACATEGWVNDLTLTSDPCVILETGAHNSTQVRAGTYLLTYCSFGGGERMFRHPKSPLTGTGSAACHTYLYHRPTSPTTWMPDSKWKGHPTQRQLIMNYSDAARTGSVEYDSGHAILVLCLRGFTLFVYV